MQILSKFHAIMNLKYFLDGLSSVIIVLCSVSA